MIIHYYLPDYCMDESDAREYNCDGSYDPDHQDCDVGWIAKEIIDYLEDHENDLFIDRMMDEEIEIVLWTENHKWSVTLNVEWHREFHYSEIEKLN